MTAAGEVDELLRVLRDRDVRLTADGTRLSYDAPADALDADLLAALRRLKPHLLDRLRAPADPDGQMLATAADGQVLATAPASHCQARQYQITEESGTPVLTVALRFTLRGRLDRAALHRALSDLAVRHPALRTRYAERDGEVLQQVLTPRPVPVPVRPVATEHLDRAVEEWASVPFALRREPAFRAVLFQPVDAPDGGEAEILDDGEGAALDGGEPDRHELVLALHHGIIDGLAAQVLVRDLGELYRAAVTGHPADLPPLPADYLDFSREEQAYLDHGDTRRMLREWAEGLPAGTVPLLLPTDRPRRPGVTDTGGVAQVVLPAGLVAEVAGYGVRRNATPYVVLAAAFAWFLHDLTGAPVVTLTIPVANRADSRFDDVLGVFAQAAWLIIPVAGAGSFDDLVRRTAEATWQVLARQAVPGLVQNAALGGAFAGNPPRIHFSMLDLPDPVLRLPGVEPAPGRDVLLAGARANQTWQLRPRPDGTMSLLVEYAATLFDAGTVAGWLDRYQRLLPRLLATPERPLPRTGGPVPTPAGQATPAPAG
ncbi:condensation domain-containing protein [Micromonospora cathayae]|uniref:Condensation domain-containing protein n=1 Tax=Micromonospora cathayae TaxID=3028804 RepID=A0ABY7ZJ41_9ACTN|nr:condensation domain-containing protein [Micromonospora sp. HUAS 3]WDZ82892.1 condensation domain-containing protein [Micromonospora sp. HUAS 3]